MKKKFVIAGTSGRGYLSYGSPLVPNKDQKDQAEHFGFGDDSAFKEEFSAAAELVGVYDINIGRARFVGEQLGVPAFEDFDRMLEETKPDCVIVTSTDYSHAEYLSGVWMPAAMFLRKNPCVSMLSSAGRFWRRKSATTVRSVCASICATADISSKLSS